MFAVWLSPAALTQGEVTEIEHSEHFLSLGLTMRNTLMALPRILLRGNMVLIVSTKFFGVPFEVHLSSAVQRSATHPV